MKKAILFFIFLSMLTLIAVILVVPKLQAQESNEEGIKGEPPTRGDEPPREKFKEGMRRQFIKRDEIAEGEKFLEEVKKYKDEINALETQLDPIRKEVRSLFQQIQKAASDQEREQIKSKLDAVTSKEDDLDLAIAKKKKEFSEMNFKLALERMIEAEVEYRETERRIRLRHDFMGRHMPGDRGPRKRDREREEEPKGPPSEPEDEKD